MSADSDAPIFILSHARAGSTLVRHILDAHPRVASPPESFVGRAAHALCQLLASTGSGPSGWGQSIHSPEVVGKVREILNEPLQRYAHDRGKFIWCEKTPDNALFLETIATVFPDARYVCVHRHGLDVAHSWAEFAGPQSGLHHLFPGQAEERPYKSLLSWTDITSQLLAFEHAHRDACHRVRYEQLVTTPEQTVSALLSFLRLDSPGSRPADLIERAFLQPRPVGFGCPKAQTSTRITTDAIGKGLGLSTEALSDDQFRRFNELLTRLGYSPVTRRSGDSCPPRAETTGCQPSDDVLTESLTLAASDLYSQAGGDRSLVSVVVEDPVTSRELLRLGHAAEATIVVSPRVLQGLVSDRENAGEAFLQGRLRVIGNPIRGLEFCQRFAHAAAHGRRSSLSVLG